MEERKKRGCGDIKAHEQWRKEGREICWGKGAHEEGARQEKKKTEDATAKVSYFLWQIKQNEHHIQSLLNLTGEVGTAVNSVQQSQHSWPTNSEVIPAEVIFQNKPTAKRHTK